MANFKIALSAGHYKYTKGKNCLKSLDPNETREWVLNDRIADKVEKLLSENYTGYELLRLDDTTGETPIYIEERTDAANNWCANFYLAIHHNGGINGGKGGGIVAYVYTEPDAISLEWQKELYDALIEATGLKGNRYNPLPRKNLHEVREPKMPSVLLELGFMDSATDVPIILTEEYADKCANAIAKVLVKRGNLAKKESNKNILYRVQVGSFFERENAQDLVNKLEAMGIKAIIVEGEAKDEGLILSVGDKVKLQKDATVYGKEIKFSGWVYDSVLFVREIKDNRVVISVVETGPITGTVDKKYLTKI